MTTRYRALLSLPLLASGLFLAGCQSQLQGSREGDFYHSPAAAYTVDLSINTFRGKVSLDERCDPYGGSTTLWDGSGRMFRIDYLKAEGNPNVRTPRFAADQTLLNLVLNGYLRSVVAEAPLVKSAEVVHRELLQDNDPRSLFAVVSLDVDSDALPDTPAVTGRYYYGFLLFKKGELIYAVQHRQPALMPESMKAVLLRLADAMEMPGQERNESEIERTRRMLSRLSPKSEKASPTRLCIPPTVAGQ